VRPIVPRKELTLKRRNECDERDSGDRDGVWPPRCRPRSSFLLCQGQLVDSTGIRGLSVQLVPASALTHRLRRAPSRRKIAANLAQISGLALALRGVTPAASNRRCPTFIRRGSNGRQSHWH